MAVAFFNISFSILPYTQWRWYTLQHQAGSEAYGRAETALCGSKEVQPPCAQAIFRRFTRILASKVTMQNDSFCIPDVQAGILYRFHCQFRCHRCAIGIADDFTAAQIHDRRQISPSFFLHMDVGNICAPFLVDGFRSKITFQDPALQCPEIPKEYLLQGSGLCTFQ